MKPTILIILLSFLSHYSFSQNRIGLEAGIGEATFSPVNFFNSDYDYQHTSRPDFTINLSYLRKIGGHGYIGAKMYFEKYSFNYEQDDYSSPAYFAGIVHKSSYLFFAPVADVGLGRRQVLHMYFTGGVGFLLNGYQKTHETFEPGYFQRYSDTTFISSGDIDHVVSRMGFGLIEHIRLNKLWHITINEGFTFMLTDLTIIKNITEVRPGYLSLQVGLMRKLKPKTIDKGKTVEKEK